jgi:hypothetical protein
MEYTLKIAKTGSQQLHGTFHRTPKNVKICICTHYTKVYNILTLFWAKTICESGSEASASQSYNFISKFHISFETQLIETTKCIPMVISETWYAVSYFEIVFSVVHRFSLKIVLNCAITRCGLVFRIGVGILIVPVLSECRELKKDLQVRGLSISTEVQCYH